ncbi:hypothetical protein GCM10009827_101880 [Dactylosporangium maewongense]|uniref:Uncharacterized protein n=1 Tax=Dactylosporangium maewongense TaxID=634393 RepID=A0ABP4NSJ1_9ACTN
MSHLLDIHNLAVNRGAGDVVRDVNLTVRAGELALLLVLQRRVVSYGGSSRLR